MWRERWKSSNLKGALPRKAIWLLTLYILSSEACTEMLPLYISPARYEPVVLLSSRFLPRGGADTCGKAANAILRKSGDAIDTQARSFLREFTTTSITAARILVALDSKHENFRCSSYHHAHSMLLRLEMCRHAAEQAHRVYPPSTRSGRVVESNLRGPEMTRAKVMYNGLHKFMATQHYTSVYEAQGGHRD
eukprot:5810350-Pleurochrysis_carterae.AAC.1